MSKAYSVDDLATQLAEDRNWRLREISDLKSTITRSDRSLQTVLLRAAVAIFYAHWEGSVRFSARKYFEHISLRKFRYRELDRQFLRNYFLPRLASLSKANISVLERCKLVDEILNSSDVQYAKVDADLVNTRANLSYDVFSDICLVCGLDAAPFERQREFIDLTLLRRRNQIAHGEETLVAISELNSMSERVIGLMRGFGDALENRVVLGEYRAA